MNLAYKRFIFIIFFMTVSSCSYQKTTIEIGSLFDPTWDFSNSSQLNFDENYVEIKNGKAQLKPLDLKHEGDDFNNGTHVGTHVNKLNKFILNTGSNAKLLMPEVLPSKMSNLVGHWAMDGDWTDSSGNLHQATPVSDPNFGAGVKGIYGGEFSGINQYSRVSSRPALELNTSVTMTSWVKTSSTSNYSTIMGKMTSGTPRNGYWISVDNLSHIRCDIQNQSAPAGLGALGSINVEDGNWHFVACTYDGASIKIYVDGQLDTETPYVGGIGVSTEPFYIGTDSIDFIGRSYSGSIDEVTLWNTTLSSDELFELYEAQKSNFTELSSSWTPKWDNIVGYWKMDGNWQDSSGEGNHGVANSDVNFTDAKIGSHSGAFDGTGDYIETSSFQSPSGNLSFSSWFKVNSLSSRNAIAFRMNNDGLYPRLFVQTDGSLLFQYRVDPGVSHTFSSPPNLARVNEWVHIFATYSEIEGAKIYFNGQLVASKADAGVLETDGGSPTMLIGHDSNFVDYMNGALDEVGLWHTTLNAQDILTIYNRQKQKYASHYDSEVIELGNSNSTWPDLSWSTSLPFGKELVGDFDNDGSPDSERSSDYSAISGHLSSGLIGFWTFNEKTLGSAPDIDSGPTDFFDFSGNELHIKESGSVSPGEVGRLQSAIKLDGIDDVITVSNVSSLSQSYNNDQSLSLWVKVPKNQLTPGAGLNRVFVKNAGAAFETLSLYNQTHGFDGKIVLSRSDGTLGVSLISNKVINDNNYHHVLYRKKGSQLSLFIDGVLDNQVTDTTNSTNIFTTLRFGRNSGISAALMGHFDEASYWNRAVSDQEIQQLYRRGANRIKFQVKSCVDSSCECKSLSTSPVGTATDCDGDTIVNALDFDDIHKAEFIGPGGDGTTYYSELFNRKSTDLTFNCGLNTSDSNSNVCVNDEITLGAGPKPTGPVIDYSDFPLEARPDANPYFQYRVYMEADENTACNGNPCLPELTSVNLNPSGLDRYYGALQEITPKSPITYSEMKSISIQADPCATFRLSPDGTNEYYYSAGSWVLATDITHRSDQLTVEQNILKFAADHGPGQLYIKAFLETSSNQTANCGVDEIDVDFK